MSDYTEEQIVELRDKAVAFEELLFDYLDERRRWDPKLKNFWPRDGEEYDLDPRGDSITIEWHESDSCGDTEYMMLDFPLADLWTDQSAQLRRWEEKQRKEKEAAEAKATKRAEDQQRRKEKKERDELTRLQAKYGATP